MISRYFGDAVFPMITIIVIIMFGISHIIISKMAMLSRQRMLILALWHLLTILGLLSECQLCQLHLLKIKSQLLFFVVVVDALFSKFIEMILD
ncbi:MAG: hypothetical protein OES15_06570 [Nitrosopumilus sp.]|nr:hypothetical protein [Nitrosopumilus sp.]